MKKIMFVVFLLVVASTINAQSLKKGTYDIIGVGSFSDGKKQYATQLKDGINVVMADDKTITITINNYLVDMLSIQTSKMKDNKMLIDTKSLLDECDKTLMLSQENDSCYTLFYLRSSNVMDFFILKYDTQNK